jgi:hypothetical protein
MRKSAAGAAIQIVPGNDQSQTFNPPTLYGFSSAKGIVEAIKFGW